MEVAVTVCLLGGIISAALASTKRRSVVGWFVIGALIPVIGLILILVLPSPSLDISSAIDLVPEPGPYQDLDATIVARRTHLQSATLDAITRLVDLKERGQLSAYEFEERRAELLARM